MVDHGGLEFPKDLSALSFLADQNLLVVGSGIAKMLRLIAILGDVLKVLSLHLFEGFREADEEVIDPLLRYVSGRFTLNIAIIDSFKLVEVLVVVGIEHLLQNLA